MELLQNYRQRRGHPPSSKTHFSRSIALRIHSPTTMHMDMVILTLLFRVHTNGFCFMALASPTRNFLSLLPAYLSIFGVVGLRFRRHQHQETSQTRPCGRTISFISGVRGIRLVAVRCPRRVGAGIGHDDQFLCSGRNSW